MVNVFARSMRAHVNAGHSAEKTLMKKRTKILSVMTAAAIACTVTLAGCSLVSADSQADMEQIIAEVDISKAESLDASLAEYAGAVSNTSIKKRELVAYFLNSGSTLVQNGSTYGEAFETLAKTLVNNAILVQYATLSTLQDMAEDSSYTAFSTAAGAVEWFNAFETDAERYEALLKYQEGVDDYEGDNNVDYVLLSRYTMMSSLNSSIDSYEEDILDPEHDHGSSTATVPDGVDAEVENYYPVDEDGNLDYGVYTGYSGYLLSDSGVYSDDAVDGTTMWSRRQAYNRFIQVLDANYLITEEDDISDVWSLEYVQSDYVNLLSQQMLSNYFDLYENEFEESIEADSYAYVSDRYEELLSQQSADYGTSSSALTSFETAMGDLSDTSFILYAPDTDNGNKFGYIYNILLPFSSQQEVQLESLSSQLENDALTQDGYYAGRNEILKKVTSTDQRSSWFNGGEDYSFDASASGISYYNGGNTNRTILFFEDNLTNNERYEKLDKYYGQYTYNGTAVKNADDSYTLIANKINIDDMLGEFSSYLDYVLGTGSVDYGYWSANGGFAGADNSAYYANDSFTDENGEIDYSKFMYAYGKVDLGTFVASDLTNPDSDYYKAMSAVNELQYAYTTDTSVLSEYIGYTVGAYSTSYIKEFEYAAQYAIREGGVGAFAVCAGDYGWHLIYVTYVLEPDSNGEIYDVDWTRIDTEGTFEYNFYEMIKSSDLENVSTRYQSNLLQSLYQADSSVVLYEDRYSDLTSLTTGSSSTTA